MKGKTMMMKGKKKGKKMMFGVRRQQTLRAAVGVYPGYDGTLSPDGVVTLRFNDDGSHLLKADATGLPPNCVDCGIHVHEGRSCAPPDTVGPHYWNAEVYPDDPWNVDGFYDTDENGVTMSGFVIDSGHGFRNNNGRTVVFHMSNGTRFACGELVPVRRRDPSQSMLAELGPYPGYTGDLEVRGTVHVDFFSDDTIDFAFGIAGVEPDCVECGIHIHSGTTCDDASLVGGHYWDADELGEADPWVAQEGAYYTSDAYGLASRNFFLYHGFGFNDNVGHAVVVHASDGSRIACGVLSAGY